MSVQKTRGVKARRLLGERIMNFIEAEDKPRAYRPIELARIMNVAESAVRSAMETLASTNKLRADRAKGGAKCWRLNTQQVLPISGLTPGGSCRGERPPEPKQEIKDACDRAALLLRNKTIQRMVGDVAMEWVPELVIEADDQGRTKARIDLGFLDGAGDPVIEPVSAAAAYALRILLITADAVEHNVDMTIAALNKELEKQP